MTPQEKEVCNMDGVAERSWFKVAIPRIKSKYGLVEQLIRDKARKIRGACCVLIKKKESQSIIQRPINKLDKLEGSGSKATAQLKFIDKNEIKNVTSAK